jgi:hypothetical protein
VPTVECPEQFDLARGSQDVAGRLDLHKAPRLLTRKLDGSGDGGFELMRATTHASPQLLLGEQRASPVEQVELSTCSMLDRVFCRSADPNPE